MSNYRHSMPDFPTVDKITALVAGVFATAIGFGAIVFLIVLAP